MHRFLKTRGILVALLIAAGFMLVQSESARAVYLQRVSGYLTPGQTKVFYPRVPNNSALDTIYEIAGTYSVSGTLTVMEGAEVRFDPNSRIVDSAGGRIVANGFSGLNRRILFRGLPINPNSLEWGHFLILPGSYAYFANCRFVNFRKRTFVDTTLIYAAGGSMSSPQALANNTAINNAANGVGAVICTFARQTYLYDIIVDSSQAAFAGGAFAFLQQPANFVDATNPVPNDDGRLALTTSPSPQVMRLIIRDCKVIDEVQSTGAGSFSSTTALGGAIYMASNTNAISASNFVNARLGYDTNGVLPLGGFISQTQDTIIIERCAAINPQLGTQYYAKGGGVYVGSNTGLFLSNASFNNDSAISMQSDSNSWGGAIAVSASSGNQSTALTPVTLADRVPGLTIYKSASFNTNFAGMGGAIHLDCPPNAGATGGVRGPVLYIDGEHFLPAGAQSPQYPIGFTNQSTIPYRDSGLIVFQNNVANLYGGAIFTSYHTFVNGYLAPQNFPWPGGNRPVELRVRYMNNVAAKGGGALFIYTAGLYGPSNGTPAPGMLSNHRVWYQNNSVNAYDPRVLVANHTTPLTAAQRSAIAIAAYGGGAEWVGFSDSTYATEYNSNLVIGGNGGGVGIVGAISSSSVPVNRLFAEDGYVVNKPNQSRIPSDPRELTRFLNNQCYMGSDSAAEVGTYVSAGTAHARGGGIYLKITTAFTTAIGLDSTFMSRVRMEQNTAFTGSAIFSDNFDLRFITNLCLIANNHSTSLSSSTVDLDATGPTAGISNPSDANAGATIWADFEGSLPSYQAASRGDAIYDNVGRYLLRLPVSPITGLSGTDTMRGLFWGESGPDVITQINPPNGAFQSTFFIDYFNGCFGKEIVPPQPPPYGVYEPNSNPPQGYVPVPIGQIPDTTLMEGRVYDLYDRGIAMKVADYNDRRLSPSEDFALALPSDIVRIHRYTRNIFDQDPVYVSKIDLYQTDFQGPHPIGYPLFLQADVSLADSNRDDYAKDYTVYFVINQTTNEFVRVNLKETVAAEGSSASQQTYQGRLDFIPDSAIAIRHAADRAGANWSLSLLRPSPNTDFNEIQRAASLEDAAALQGREYPLDFNSLTDAVNHDTVCTQGISGTTYWFAGEKYHTLPVRPGDRIAVVSRSQLWKYGAGYALSHGLQFVIGDVLPPTFVSDIPNLQADPYNPNVRFVHEDVNYDGSNLAKTLFRVGGFDPNQFYDPRFLFNPGNYTQVGLMVTYDTGVDGPYGVRLNRWLKQTVMYNQNITGSNGYILISGTPHNPDVVPGGEALTATVTNFPPNYASEFGLKHDIANTLLGADSNALSMWTFPRYMNWNTAVCPQPGFEPDTLCVRATSSTYHFRIIVMDSLPVFLSTPPPRCAASLTDSLRYIYDVNTDDEAEDAAAAAETPRAWDFRYGRTTYKMLTRPIWMQRTLNNFQPKPYGTIDTDAQFTNFGKMYVAVDSAWAVQNLLTPTPQVNGELNFDTTISVEAHDGHTGKSIQRWAVTVNIAPAITTTALPPAKEGIDYSLNFTDPNLVNRILIYDPNYADFHTYKLIYKGQVDTEYRDPLYKVGKTGLVGTTPNWLKIDQYSGVLTGVPSDSDAPRSGQTSCGPEDTVLVVVTDQCGLTTWKWLPIEVDSTQHVPGFVRGPKQLCIWNNQQFCDTVKVFDRDLLRPGCLENLTITSLNTDVTVTPGSISGMLSNDTANLVWCMTPHKQNSYFQSPNPIPDTVKIQVTDVAGNTDILTFPVRIGDNPTFQCPVWVSNPVVKDPVTGNVTHPMDIQKLIFGAGNFGSDSLDIRYCEVEIPPAPHQSVFDARWVLPTTNAQLEGTQIDIRRDTAKSANITWQISFNAGNETGNNLYPVAICWSSACAKNATGSNSVFNGAHLYLRNPQNSQKFSIDMSSGQGLIDPTLYTLQTGSDTMCLSIRDVNLKNALIILQPAGSGVMPTEAAPAFALEPNHPNPFTSATTIDFKVAERSNVRIEIFDIKGNLVRTLVSEMLDAGSYPVTWDGTNAAGEPMPNGTYIATMTAGSFTTTMKMSLEHGQ